MFLFFVECILEEILFFDIGILLVWFWKGGVLICDLVVCGV